MNFIKRLFFIIAFLVSSVYIQIVLFTLQQPAYGYSEADLKELLQTNNCQNCDLQGADLSGANLAGADMRDARLRDVDFNKVRVKGADFMWAKYLTNEQKYYLRKNGALNVSESLK